MYLEKRGVKLENKDVHGNTPLAIALQAGHFNFGIIMIQKNADVKALIHAEDHKRADAMIRDKLRDELPQDEDNVDSQEDENAKNRKRRIKVLFQVADDSSDEETDEEPDQATAQNTNLFGRKLTAKRYNPNNFYL